MANLKEIGIKIIDKLPLLGSLFGAGGTVAGTALKVVAQALGLKEEEVTAEKINEIIESKPEVYLKLKEIEASLSIKEMETDLETLKTYTGDVQNARGREIEITKTTKKKDINLYALAWVIIIGFFCLTGLLIFKPIPDNSSQAVYMLFGGLVGYTGSVIQYFFGSSKSSQDKTQLLKK